RVQGAGCRGQGAGCGVQGSSGGGEQTEIITGTLRNYYEITCARLCPFWPFSGRGSKPGYTLRVQYSRVALVAAEAIADGTVSYGDAAAC
ncbi:MAG: hypothetical protein PHY82_01125, partial [Lentisphaeria bacterium]|nr:hypothetical protein [Lentisphaeria bacterium]